MLKNIRYLIAPALIWTTGCTGSLASSGSAAGGGGSSEAATVSAKEISAQDTAGYRTKRLKLSLTDHRDAYVLMYLATQSGPTVVPRPTVLITKPYEGFDWSEDATDLKWSNHANASAGYSANDDDSVGYDPASGQVVGYARADEAGLFGEANFYLLHDVNVAFVFTRFYSGTNFVTHARDTEMALRYLAAQPAVDADRLGVYGLSWGGMTAGLGVALANVPVKRLILQSPAINVPALRTHFQAWVPAHVTTPSQLTLFANFFAPYGRRIGPVLDTALGAAADVNPLLQVTTLAAKIGALVDHTVMLVDQWDTLVPFASSKAIADQMGPSRASGLYWTHAAPLDYETAPLSHNAHPTDSLRMSQVLTLMQMEFADALLPANENITLLLYDVDVWNYYLNYMRGEQQRGVDVSALTRALIQMSTPRVTIVNQQDYSQYGAGSAFVSNWLNLYWGVNVAPAAVHAYLVNQGLPP